jgi:hypothetical protein
MNKLPIGLVAYARFFESYFTKTNEHECKKKSSGSCLSLEHIKIYVKKPRFEFEPYQDSQMSNN